MRHCDSVTDRPIVPFDEGDVKDEMHQTRERECFYSVAANFVRLRAGSGSFLSGGQDSGGVSANA